MRLSKAKVFMATVIVISWGLLAGAQAFAQTPGVAITPENLHDQLPKVNTGQRSPANSVKQVEKRRQALREYNFEQMKKHAERLSKMAAALQKEIAKSNEDVLSLEIVRKAARIEKLAKKIKQEAKRD